MDNVADILNRKMNGAEVASAMMHCQKHDSFSSRIKEVCNERNEMKAIRRGGI